MNDDVFYNQKKVLFRCDASSLIGSGHVMRCLTLSFQLYKQGISSVFLTNDGGERVIKEFSSYPVEISLSREYINEQEQFGIHLLDKKYQYVVWDSYSMDENDLNKISMFIPTMVVDDIYLLPHYSCDAILNQNLYADAACYNIAKQTTVLAGSLYTMLRESFNMYHYKRKIISPKTKKVLLTFGGADIENNTLCFLSWLRHYQETALEITVVLGSHYQYEEEIKHFLQVNSYHHTVIVQKNVKNMAELLWKQDIVISAGGSTLYELACLGVPSLCVITADNQRKLVYKAEDCGYAMSLNEMNILTKESFLASFIQLANSVLIRQDMSQNGKKTIDGLGAKRVASYIAKQISKR